MKKFFKIISIILTLILAVGICGFAGGQMQNIWVEFNTVNLIVDGIPVDASNILYNGTTYVPLRRTAEILGKEVGWNQSTNTASINSKMEDSRPSINTDSEEMIKIKIAAVTLDRFVWMIQLGSRLNACYIDGITIYNDYANNRGKPDRKAKYYGYLTEEINSFKEKSDEIKTLKEAGTALNLDFSTLNAAYNDYQLGIDALNSFYVKIAEYDMYHVEATIDEASNLLNQSFKNFQDGKIKFSELYYSCLDYITD